METTKEVATTQVTFNLPSLGTLDSIESLDTTRSLAVNYKTQEEWQKYLDKPLRCFYLGLQELPNEDGELIKVGAFMSKEENFLSGQMILVDQVKLLEPNTPIEITYKGKKANKTTKGSTNIFEVKLLG